MNPTQFLKRFFGSKRGQIVSELRRHPQTVADLAASLSLTDNAIRSHLTTLERDGLVRQFGERAGFRKPHLEYELSREAEGLFPKSYRMVLNCLMSAIKEHRGEGELANLLRIVGHQISDQCRVKEGIGRSGRIGGAVAALNQLGAEVEIETTESQTTLLVAGCPLSATVASHPEICAMMEEVLTDSSGIPVRQKCRHEPNSRCCFEILWPPDMPD